MTETVFKVLDNPDGEKIGEFLKSLDCPIEVRIESECNAVPYGDWTDEQRDRLARLYFGEECSDSEIVNFAITLSKEELEQIEQGDKVVILRNVKIEAEVP